MTARDLTSYVDHYLALRTALGFRLQAERTLLYSFARFVGDRCVHAPLRAHLAVEWACAAKNHGRQAAPAQRLSMVRQLLLYLRAHEPTTEVPSHHLIAVARRRTPYLLTPAHIRMLLDAARQAPASRSFSPQTLTTLLGVLASTGIRIGEALRLTLGDVDLDGDPPRLLIAQTKFQKSRWVPLHSTTAAHLRTYARACAQRFAPHSTAPFFLSATGGPVAHHTVLRWFTKTCRRLGIWPSGNGRRPCLHSLRHSFAVQRLVQWEAAGADLALLLPHLSVYLGHVRPQESYWYLTATPEVLTHAADRFQAYITEGGEQRPVLLGYWDRISKPFLSTI